MLKGLFKRVGAAIRGRSVVDDDLMDEIEEALIQADVTYPPSMAATAISLAVKGMRGEPLDGFYQQQVPAKIILAAELITKENAEKYYEPDSIY